MEDFVRIPDALSEEDREQAWRAFLAASEADADEAARSAAKWGNVVLAAYDALNMRVRLAELVLYRAMLLQQDLSVLIMREGRKSPPRTVDVKAAERMLLDFVRDYVDPVIVPLREALGYEAGDEARGWYAGPEEARAKLVGNRRAKERLAREGHPRLSP